uniref:uncharacterized protein LOC122584940 n=1 Tax=Erigeron canadensis TaxID=72917 RepID=UPI001CB921E7|nr:uncharacterized protein LOC122584940 [Erigeron canadensis]
MTDQHHEKEEHDRHDEEEVTFPENSMDISDQIGRALEKYTPLLLKRLNQTMEGAMNDHIAQMIREEVALNVQWEFEKRWKREGWVSEIEGSFRTSQFPEDLKVVYAVSMLRDKAKRWWDNLLMVKKGALDNVDWSEFKAMFYKKFRSEAEVTRLRSEFLNDSQGTLSLTEFRAQFLDKAQFCPEFLENEQLMKEQFYMKLKKSLRERISLCQMESFSMLCDVARDYEIEQTRVDENEVKRKYDGDNSQNKRFKQDGASGSNAFRRNTPFCKTCKRNHHGSCREKACYNCGKTGHVSRDCRSKPHNPLICFKCFEEGHMKSSCPKLTEEERQEDRRREAERRNTLAHGTFLMYNVPMRILFDSGANRSLVATRMIHVIPMSKSSLDHTLQVEVGNGRTEIVRDVYKNCEIKIVTEFFQANLIPFPMGEFDVILGMDWLSSCNAKIACDEKAVYLKTSKGEDLIVYGDRNGCPIPVCTFARARRYLSHGYHAYLAHIVDVKKKSLSIEDIPIVRDFSNVFPDNLLGVPPKRQVEFSIDLVPGANPIAKAPYQLAPTEMQEMMKQL